MVILQELIVFILIMMKNKNVVAANEIKLPVANLKLIDLWLESKHLSTHTRKAYSQEARRLLYWVKHIRSLSLIKMDANAYSEFLDWLLQPPGDERGSAHPLRIKALSFNSLAQARRITSNFLQWLVIKEHARRNPAWTASQQATMPSLNKYPVIPRKICVGEEKAGNHEVLSLLFGKIIPDEGGKLRAAVIANLAFWSGATCSQISAMQRSDIKLTKTNTIVSLTCRDGNVRKIEMPDYVGNLIRRYLSKGDKKISNLANAPLISNLNSTESLSPWSIRNALKKLPEHKEKSAERRKANFTCVQDFRRLFVHNARTAGVPDSYIAYHLGLKEITTSARLSDQSKIVFQKMSCMYADLRK